uniref:Uncharacterized protein n=1 Tax=Glossina pallidipes TaxID=7398 RepID=A0A1A9Z838_GLOPL
MLSFITFQQLSTDAGRVDVINSLSLELLIVEEIVCYSAATTVEYVKSAGSCTPNTPSRHICEKQSPIKAVKQMEQLDVYRTNGMMNDNVPSTSKGLRTNVEYIKEISVDK